MKYKKITPHSYKWITWLHICWIFSIALLVTTYIFTKSASVLLGLILMSLIAIFYIRFSLKNMITKKKIVKSIHEHIYENELCTIEKTDQREYFRYYPEVHFKLDDDTLYIRFRLTGNKINLRGLEKNLSDRLKKECINIFETRGYIEYLFKKNEEKQLDVTTATNATQKLTDTQLLLSPSFIWDYVATPHFMIAGSTGVGKTTLVRYMMDYLTTRNVRITYIDLKRDRTMECYCKNNPMITSYYEEEGIIDAVRNIAYEMQRRKKEIDNIGNSPDFNYQFSPIFLICDELVLLKLLLPKSTYDEIFDVITAIISAGLEKKIFCGLITQSTLAEYLGNSTLRASIGLKISLGQTTQSETTMIFGDKFNDVKNLRYNEKGAGLIMRKDVDSRPREFIAPLIE